MSGPIQSDPSALRGIHQAQDEPVLGDGQTKGSYRGERVELVDVESLLQEAAEELTFEFSEPEEKALAQRHISDAAKHPQGHERLMRIHAVLGKLPDFNRSELERILQILMRMRQQALWNPLQQVREHLSEPAHQYAALLALAERLRQENAPASQLAVVERALSQLEQEQGPAIRAALNIAEVADEFSQGQLGDLHSLRATYRDAVLDAADLSQTFKTLKERYGDSDLLIAIKYLLKALAADLAADGPSIDRAKLNALLDDLYRLEVLGGLLEDCGQLVERYRPPGVGFRAADLLGELLLLQVQTWLSPESVKPLPGKLGVSALARQIGFLREFRALAASIPLKAYADPEQRRRLLDAIQQALDEAIGREEEGG